MHHTLKTHPGVFAAVRDGTMRFQVRKDDRYFQRDDTVTLEYHDGVPVQPWSAPPAVPDPEKAAMTFRVGFVLRGGQYGIEPGYVVFGLEDEIPDCAAQSRWIDHDGKKLPDIATGIPVTIRRRDGKEYAAQMNYGLAVDSNWLHFERAFAHEADIMAYRVPK
ncbi:hypothetical protein HMSP1_74 [Sinorhizobium phage HMSP1-Susan]|nr:hypothetical protein HMSP1_74 [Sinorhizobium phage HMSP1-Susan]